MFVLIHSAGLTFHIGMRDDGAIYQADETDSYVTDGNGSMLAQLDNLDDISVRHPVYGFISLRTAAEEEYADGHGREG